MGYKTDTTYSTTLQKYASLLRELVEDVLPLIETSDDPEIQERLALIKRFPQVFICINPNHFNDELLWSFDDQKVDAIHEAAQLARKRIQHILNLLGIGALIHLDINPESWEPQGRFDLHWNRVGHLAFTPGLFPTRWIKDLENISQDMDSHVEKVWMECKKRNDSPPGSDMDRDNPHNYYR